MAFWSWSRTAATNASADTSINWAEGQAPSSINDSARAMMARTAEYRDDIAGAIVTGGTSTAYTVTSYEVFDTLAHMNAQMIAFTPHTTNAATVTLNVDGLGAKPLRSAPSTELLAGVLIQGTPYVATYNNSDAVWYLRGFYGNPYNIPLAGGLDYWGATTPNSAFVFPSGQAISRTVYAALYAIVGNNYGTGDGSTTFNLPDLRGRVVAALDNMGGSAASRLTSTYFGVTSGFAATSLGATGGDEKQTLTQAQLPNVTLSVSGTASVTSTATNVVQGTVAIINFAAGGNPANSFSSVGTGSLTSTGSSSGTTGAMGSGNAHQVVQPTICSNYIMRVI